MRRTLRPLIGAALALAAALTRPAAASAQDTQICREQGVPEGHVVTGIGMSDQCPGAQAATYNSITVRVPGDTVTVCNALSQLGQGYAVTGRSSLERCPNFYGGRPNATTYRRVMPPPPPLPQPQRPGPAPAPSGALAVMDRYDRAVFRRLDDLEEWLGLDAPTHHPWLSRLADGATARSSIQVEGGMRYTLVAVCDDDCDDIDLRVLDGTYVVGQDVAPDENATVQISPGRSGTLTVEAIMGSCKESPCRYGVAVYETPRPGSRPQRPRRP